MDTPPPSRRVTRSMVPRTQSQQASTSAATVDDIEISLPRTRAATARKTYLKTLTDEQQNVLTSFINTLLIKHITTVNTKKIIEMLKLIKDESSLKNKKFLEVCSNIFNNVRSAETFCKKLSKEWLRIKASLENVSPATVNQFIEEVIKNRQSQPLSIQTESVMVNIYKRFTIDDFLTEIKYNKYAVNRNLSTKIDPGKAALLSMALNDPSSTLFNSLLNDYIKIDIDANETASIVENYIKDISLVIELINIALTATPPFNINTNKDGFTILMVSIIQWCELLRNAKLSLADVVATLIVKLLGKANIDTTMPCVLKNYSLGIGYKTADCYINPFSFLLYMFLLLPVDVRSNKDVSETVSKVLDLFFLKTKTLDVFKTVDSTLGKIVFKDDNYTVILDNYWIATNLNPSYIEDLIETKIINKDDFIKNGRLLPGRSKPTTIQWTYDYDVKTKNAEITELEAKKATLVSQIEKLKSKLKALEDLFKKDSDKIDKLSTYLNAIKTNYAKLVELKIINEGF